MNVQLLDIPVEAPDWRAARKKALARLTSLEAFRDRPVRRTHTEPSIVFAPDFRTWIVTVEFAA